MLTIQAQETALQPVALRALEDLKRTSAYNDKLQERLKKAISLITDTSTQLNDRGVAEKARYAKKRSRFIADGKEEDPEERQENEDYQQNIEALTKKMDSSIRRMIDDRVWIEGIPEAIEHVRQKAGTATRDTAFTQATTQQSEEHMDVDDDAEQDASRSLVRPDPSQAPTALLDAAFSTNEIKWQSRSLTERYSEDNDYIGWYRMVYDAKHPGDNPPPMPHASMWFATEEGRTFTAAPRGSQSRVQQTSRTRSRAAQGTEQGQSDSESDIEIAAERVRIRCPITLLPYKDPLASTKCPHAFEKSAILDMFKHTTERTPLTTEQTLELTQISRPQDRNKRERELRIPMVRCPECSVPLIEKDLRPDPVLLRKVNRMLEKEKRAAEAEGRQEADIMDAENEDDEDEFPRTAQRRNVVHLGSSPAGITRRQSGRPVKNERRSFVPDVDIDE